jgi:hypothetical protein
MHRPTRRAAPKNRGSATHIFIWIVVAVSIFAAVASKLYSDGASDVSYVMWISVVAVIAIAIVAPRRFKSIRGGSPIWEDEDPYKASSENDEARPPSEGSLNSTSSKGSGRDAT